MKIVICAVPYSPNLGDGVIYENLRQLLTELAPAAQISALDIAGRDGYDASSVSRKPLINRVPGRLRPSVVCAYFCLQYWWRWRHKWAEQLADADLIVIGGGQLFMDAHLNFPIKLFLLSRTIKAIGKSGKVAIFSVGASKLMSGVGANLFRRALKNMAPVRISARDMLSAQHMKKYLAIEGDVCITPDPAIYSQQTYAQDTPAAHGGNVLGICISCPLEVNHGVTSGPAYESKISEFFENLALQAIAVGYVVKFFTNGAPEDEVFKDALAARLNSHCIVNVPRAAAPAQLVENIRACDYIIAHRLHASIVAYALDIPAIGLNWDVKVKSFFELIGRSRFFIPSPIPDVEHTLDLLNHARASCGTEKSRLTLRLKKEVSALLESSVQQGSTAGTRRWIGGNVDYENIV
ncbi:polysaccharide pyruvyl transferase WcaK-like protein [Collimonas sp. PA-H2]|uniref:polysaccharide pyruvyl transferase family protein n=1 Tax=Collimonas sp. PA-H2 TaxID=1881062 RepID=UPI000BF3B7AA|nr:polysaccharide pyruvyl transferase family protein [Collimonas sp. PA-H2]PFH12503.1 polysaccharide pyruvyl transferase WcaK-like protein [Collimonas sp. PA-H2]